jgi:hypothetical protein
LICRICGGGAPTRDPHSQFCANRNIWRFGCTDGMVPAANHYRSRSMGMLLGFAPFIIFALLTSISVDLALWAALAAAFAITIRDFAHTRLLRWLDVGSTVLFGLLAIYAGFIQPSLSIQAVRLVVDGGLLMIAFSSMVAGNPFTLDYAREQAPQEMRTAPLFVHMGYIITGVWTIAFAAMTAADAAATFNKRFPLTLDIAAGLAALTLAVAFTARYPVHVRAQNTHLGTPR